MAESPEQVNELNYMAWKREHAIRRQQLRTQFNLWRGHQHDRMCNHQAYKHESKAQKENLRDLLQQRLENACSCQACRSEARRSSIGATAADEVRRSSIGDTGGRPLEAGTKHSMSGTTM